MRNLLIISLLLLLSVQQSLGQCTSCGTTYTDATISASTTLSGTTCFTGTTNYITADITISDGTIICVSPGTTLNLNSNNYNIVSTNNIVLNVYGTVKFNTNPNLNGKWTINVYSGGVLNYGTLQFISSSGAFYLNNSGTFSGGKLEITGNTADGSVTNTGSMTISDDLTFAGNSFNFFNNSSTALSIKTIALSNSSSLFVFDNYTTMNVTSTLNLNNGTGEFRNMGTLTVGENYNSSPTSVYVNCGTYNGKFNLNSGGKVINTGTFTTSQIDFGSSTSRIENYGTFTSSGSINASGQIYNEGIFTLSSGQLSGDGNLTGPSDSSKKGYFVWSGINAKNKGVIGPNLNFRNSTGTSSVSAMFNNYTSSEYTWLSGLTWGEADPSSLPAAACPSTDGRPSTPEPSSSSACAGIDLTTLQPSYSNVTYEWWTGTTTSRTTQITSSSTPKVTCYTTVGTVYLWAKSVATGDYSETGAAVTITDCALAWKSIKASGNWTDTDMWQYQDNSGNWITIASPPYNNAKVYISDGTTVTVSSALEVNADSLVIRKSGILSVNSDASLTVNTPLVFEIATDGSAGQLKAYCGDVTMGASSRLIARKTLDTSWDYISFPFEVSDENIFLAGTSTQANWGDLESNISDPGTINFIAAYYNGALRSTNPEFYSTSSSKYFSSLSTHKFNPLQGYIITGGMENNPSTITLDFCSAAGTSLTFCDMSNVAQSYTTGSLSCHCGWNLVGTPYVAQYNLKYALSLFSYYVWETNSYTTVGSTTNYALNPFGAFFLQTSTTGQVLNYKVGGLTDFTSSGEGTASAPEFSEVLIEIEQGNYTDKTLIRLEQNADVAYKIHEDGIKMTTSSTVIPQIYTEAEGACSVLAINVLPIDTKKVDLKIKLGTLGLNTIKISDKDNISGFSSVILVDTETGIQTDLLNNSYSFENTVTGESSRFYVLFGLNTAVEQTSTDNIRAIVNDNSLYFTGLNGNAQVNIHDVVGKTIGIYQNVVNAQAINVPQKGIYLVNIINGTQNETIKVIIK